MYYCQDILYDINDLENVKGEKIINFITHFK